MSSKKVACYCRVSTDLQQGGMESQIRVLKTYCEQNQITDVEFYTDEGISGTKSSRPALDRMMASVEQDEISSVVVDSFSRFARSTTHLLTALQIFNKKPKSENRPASFDLSSLFSSFFDRRLFSRQIIRGISVLRTSKTSELTGGVLVVRPARAFF